jgi:glutamyl-tRNA reductase
VEGEMVSALVGLKEQAPSPAEIALLSTCNRVEIIGVGPDGRRALEESVPFLANDPRLSRTLLSRCCTNSRGPPRVTCFG